VNRMQRAAVGIATFITLTTISPQRAPAEQANGWCQWVCGLSIGLVCVAYPEFCEVITWGYDPCVAYCIVKHPGGA